MTDGDKKSKSRDNTDDDLRPGGSYQYVNTDISSLNAPAPQNIPRGHPNSAEKIKMKHMKATPKEKTQKSDLIPANSTYQYIAFNMKIPQSIRYVWPTKD